MDVQVCVVIAAIVNFVITKKNSMMIIIYKILSGKHFSYPDFLNHGKITLNLFCIISEKFQSVGWIIAKRKIDRSNAIY